MGGLQNPSSPYLLSISLSLFLSLFTIMASSTTTLINPLPISKTVPTLFTNKTHYPFPIKHSSSPSLVSLRFNFSPIKIIPFVAQTSNWGEVEGNVSGEDSDGWGGEVADGEVDSGDGVSEDGGVSEGGDDEESYSEPSEDAKLFVGNLPYDVDSQKLAEIFNQAGVVEISEVIYNRETDQSRGFGFVTMSTVEDAEKAVEMFHRYDLNGRLLTVNKAAPRGSTPERPQRVYEPLFKIYVGNLPWQMDDARLEQVFSEHGKVVNARVVFDRETGRSRGFGFVTMSSETEVNDAITALDGQSLDGRAIRVNVAEDRTRSGSF